MACNEGKKLKNKAPECEKLDCWCFPEPYVERTVKVRNKKHCWLYPKRETKELVKLLPNFECCKTLYTKCDYRLENYVSKQLLLIEELIHKHKNKLDNEIVFQRSLIEQMWKLSQRFLLLTHCRLSTSLDALRFAIKKLNLLCSQLDMTVESPFIIGDYKNQPLSYYRKLIDDAFDYFNDVLCKLKSWAQLLDIGDTNALDEYKALLDPTKKYDEFMKIGKLECTCMRTKNPECIDNVVNKC